MLISHRPNAALALLIAMATIILGLPPAAQGDNDAMETRYEPFQRLLSRHLQEKDLPNEGLSSAFDYQAALDAADTEALLDEQKRLLSAFDPATLTTRDDAVAFWINAYNFFMVAQILENPGRDGKLVDSVRDYGSLFNPYRVFQQEKFDVGGREYSLDGIEKGILLGEDYAARGWKDASVHFAVNCASVGCPPLRADIYRPGELDAVLTENTRRALNTPRHFRLEGETLYLTSLFDWYEDDYVEASGSVRDFIAAYGDPNVRQQLAEGERIRFIDYDWDLNAPANFPEFDRN